MKRVPLRKIVEKNPPNPYFVVGSRLYMFEKEEGWDDVYDEPLYRCRRLPSGEEEIVESSVLAHPLKGEGEPTAAQIILGEMASGRLKEGVSNGEFYQGFNTPGSLSRELVSKCGLDGERARELIGVVTNGKFQA